MHQYVPGSEKIPQPEQHCSKPCIVPNCNSSCMLDTPNHTGMHHCAFNHFYLITFARIVHVGHTEDIGDINELHQLLNH